VLGYVGVLDERLDLDLLREVACALPDWEVQMVGPIAKIDRAELPQAANLRYLGARDYDELPDVMAGFDVAMMPFAANEATRSISPTKTLEYLAAGLPVVSTPVPDVVSDYGHIVDIASDAESFAGHCERAYALGDTTHADAAVEAVLARNGWDGIAARMAEILRDARTSTSLNEEQSA
jgi:glycosyltransferase involved in cell wall biosynthesis